MKTSEKIINYIEKYNQVSASELTEHLEITDRAIRKQLKKLLDEGSLMKVGRPPKVYYCLNEDSSDKTSTNTYNASLVNTKIKKLIDDNFLVVTPSGVDLEGWKGFVYWCQKRKLNPVKVSVQYEQIFKKYEKYKKDGLIDGMYKIRSSFDDVGLDKLFYIDFYSIEIFGKTKMGQMLLYAKQSQNRILMNKIADSIRPVITQVIEKFEIDGVGFVPPTVKRELQFMKQIQKRMNLDVRTISLNKIQTPIAVPQKTLSKLEDRVVNARDTISLDDKGSYNNILLIDDAVGSGATLNETAKKIRQRGICNGTIIGIAITGSVKGFEIISEI